MILDPAAAAAAAGTVAEVDRAVADCFACPRLVAWREEAGRVKRASYRDQTYWARPVPGFGDPDPKVLVVGLAPAAHGGNRTGRMFTGDRSGDVLFAGLHRTGFASSPHSVHAGDGLVLSDLRVTAPVHCAPPDNAPLPEERDRCAPYLRRELHLHTDLRAIVVLGGFGWQALLGTLTAVGAAVPRPRPAFGHGAVAEIGGLHGRPLQVFGCYHVSQQNTFTGRLTPAMLDDVLLRARAAAGLPPPGPPAAPPVISAEAENPAGSFNRGVLP